MEDNVSAPLSLSGRSKRTAEQIRRATALGKTYHDAAYRPQFALGIVCRNERDQQQLFKRIGRIAAGRDVKVLVL